MLAWTLHEAACEWLPISRNTKEELGMLALTPSAARVLRQAHRATPRLETLEARALLSGTESVISAALPAAEVPGAASPQQEFYYKQSLHKHPLVQTITGGLVQKVPMFYAPYIGSRRPDLDVIGAKGRLINGQGFVFTALELGSINSSQPGFYVFGVNRGGASAPSPFPGRPLIRFDAEVIIATSTDGFEGDVELLNAKGRVTSTTSLTQTQIAFSDNQLQVFVPASFLPSTSPAGTSDSQNHYSFVLWDGTNPSVPKRIAGFAPEFADTSAVATGFPSS
jgi:hypothetical protein